MWSKWRAIAGRELFVGKGAEEAEVVEELAAFMAFFSLRTGK